jgi:hypothetical protein
MNDSKPRNNDEEYRLYTLLSWIVRKMNPTGKSPIVRPKDAPAEKWTGCSNPVHDRLHALLKISIVRIVDAAVDITE